MERPDQPPHAVRCRRCGRPMQFSSEEVVESKRIVIFHCADCDTLEAVEQDQ